MIEAKIICLKNNDAMVDIGNWSRPIGFKMKIFIHPIMTVKLKT
jgi:hypothetical protein